MMPSKDRLNSSISRAHATLGSFSYLSLPAKKRERDEITVLAAAGREFLSFSALFVNEAFVQRTRKQEGGRGQLAGRDQTREGGAGPVRGCGGESYPRRRKSRAPSGWLACRFL